MDQKVSQYLANVSSVLTLCCGFVRYKALQVSISFKFRFLGCYCEDWWCSCASIFFPNSIIIRLILLASRLTLNDLGFAQQVFYFLLF